MALITAHPDDEVLWAGGLIQKGDWTVICCSVPRHDPIRAYKFYKCCDVLGVKSRVLPFSEGEPSREMQHLTAIEDLNTFDGILTHNVDGEYGHIHHRQVHRFVRDNFHGPLFTFGFGRGKFVYELTDEELAVKSRALRCYDHVLPYNGKMMTKWEALLDRYMTDQDVFVESFDEIND